MQDSKSNSVAVGPAPMLTTNAVQSIIAAARVASRIDADFCVQLSAFSFRLVWIAIATMHILCIGCFGVQSWVYKLLPKSLLAASLALYDVIMPVSNYRVVSALYATVAIVHGLFLLQMLVASMWYRAFRFGFSMSRRSVRNGPNSNLQTMTRNVNLLFGVFDVQGRHFGVIYVVREIFETVLQSTQAYRMSQFVPRLLVNRFFVFTIVINCWSTPLFKYKFKHNLPLERLLCLLFDIALDFTSVVGVPVVLAIPYWNQYDFAGTNFPYVLYWNDFWLVSMINELRIVFVSSWANLGSELVFSFSLLVSLQDAKHLLRLRPTSRAIKRSCFRNAIQPTGNPTEIDLRRNGVEPMRLSTNAEQGPRKKKQSIRDTDFKGTSNATDERVIGSRFVHAVHMFMILWGILLLILHFSASFQPNARHCAQQTWPWFGRKAGCMFLRINCNNVIGGTGNYTEIDAAMAGLNEQTLSYLVIRHCPYIEIPPRIQTFPNIVGLKIYNSTIARWESDAAITATHHPKMVFLFVVKTNMTQIPLGLLSRDFPHKISDIEFAWTNLTSLPENLSDLWPRDGFIMLERSQFAVVPHALLQKPIQQISLAGGVITELADEVFTKPLGSSVWVSGNPIEYLPETIVPSQSLAYMDLSYTQLQSLPSWMNVNSLPNAVFVAGHTPLCDKLEPIIASGDNSTVTPDLAVAWAAIQAGIFFCWTSGSYFYPYEAEAQQ